MTDNGVGTVVLGASTTMVEAAWQGVATPYVLRRNLTLTGSEVDPALWPVLDLAFVKNKVVLSPGVTLRITRMVLARLRQGLYLQAPGMDLLASLPDPLPNTTANRSEWGHLQMDSVGLVNRACLTPGVATEVAPTIARPVAMAPGTQKVISNASQAGCTPVPSAAGTTDASAAAGTAAAGGGDVPYMSRCYVLTSEYLDLVLLAYNLPSDTSPRPLLAGYVIWISHAAVKCEGYLDQACVQRLGAYTCFALMFPRSNATGAFTQQPSPSPASIGAGGGTGSSSSGNSSSGGVPAANQQPDPASSGGGDGDSSANVGIIVGSIVGGLLLLGTIAAGALLFLRRRRQRRSQCQNPGDAAAAGKADKAGACSSGWGGPCADRDLTTASTDPSSPAHGGGMAGGGKGCVPTSNSWSDLGAAGTGKAGTEGEGGPGTQADDRSGRTAASGPTGGYSGLGFTPRASMEPVTALTPCKPDINMAVRVEPYAPPGSGASQYPRSDSRSRSRSSAAVGGVSAAVQASAAAGGGGGGGGGGGLGKGASFRELSLCSVAEAAASGATEDGGDVGGGSLESQVSAPRYASSLVTADAVAAGGAATSAIREASVLVSVDTATATAYGSTASTGLRVAGGFAARSYGPASGATTVVGGGGVSMSYASSCENSRSNWQQAQAALSADAPVSAASDAGAAAASDAAAASAGGVEPTVTLLPVLRGRGAYGRVVEGIYCGQRVAVKLLNYMPSAAALAAAAAAAAARRSNVGAGASYAATEAAPAPAEQGAGPGDVSDAEPGSDSDGAGGGCSDGDGDATDAAAAAAAATSDGTGVGWIAETHPALRSYVDTSSAALPAPPAGAGDGVSGGLPAAGPAAASGAAPVASAACHAGAAAAQAGNAQAMACGLFDSAPQSLQPCATEISALDSSQQLLSTAGITGGGSRPAAGPILLPPPMLPPPPPMPGRHAAGGGGGGGGRAGVPISAADLLHRHYHPLHNPADASCHSSSLLAPGGTMVVAPLSPQDMFVEWQQRRRQQQQHQPGQQPPGQQPGQQQDGLPGRLIGSTGTYTGPLCCTVLGLSTAGISDAAPPAPTTLDGVFNAAIPLGLSIPGGPAPGPSNHNNNHVNHNQNCVNKNKFAAAVPGAGGAAPAQARERPLVVDLRFGMRAAGAGRSRMVLPAPALKPLGEIWSPMKDAAGAGAGGGAEVDGSVPADADEQSARMQAEAEAEASDRDGAGGQQLARREGEDDCSFDVFGVAAQRAFLQELEVLARMRHPNIVQLLAACATPPQLALVVELMDCSLDQLLHPPGPAVSGWDGGGGAAAGKAGDGASQTGAVGAAASSASASGTLAASLLSYETVLHVALQVAHALDYLHPTIVHRDIKPSNILISNADSATPTVKLADFGLSRLQETVLITKNADVGTAAYMAPELLTTTHGVVTHHVDVYALAVCVWEMLAGQRPWADATMVQIACAVGLRGERPSLDALPPGRCPPPLRSLLAQCWDAVPARRPAASELVKELVLLQQQHKAGVLAPGDDGTAAFSAGTAGLALYDFDMVGGGPGAAARRGHHPVANQLAALIRGGMVS
ncbi:hypothetical protein HXX76_012188 [Chlamydomonas incerta]|uniref:Protein kinase domain-containing protein n=1 Tax=Chlamydomonas incerta TaxID=51695 RepID=A0A835SIQ4_CHLIN|nr:hypothetical protein HXX76_012188 [Chlamydomonas incerta]|eukprot:KAG2427868.1 hypothetical protein HXX76_012188 [Chlamydomonas incerta]